MDTQQFAFPFSLYILLYLMDRQNRHDDWSEAKFVSNAKISENVRYIYKVILFHRGLV